ncbi:MAG: hypothetical protein ACI9AT_000568 [Ulvibacter sp.]|jgi:hypothetical protein
MGTYNNNIRVRTKRKFMSNIKHFILFLLTWTAGTSYTQITGHLEQAKDHEVNYEYEEALVIYSLLLEERPKRFGHLSFKSISLFIS